MGIELWFWSPKPAFIYSEKTNLSYLFFLVIITWFYAHWCFQRFLTICQNWRRLSPNQYQSPRKSRFGVNYSNKLRELRFEKIWKLIEFTSESNLFMLRKKQKTKPIIKIYSKHKAVHKLSSKGNTLSTNDRIRLQFINIVRMNNYIFRDNRQYKVCNERLSQVAITIL